MTGRTEQASRLEGMPNVRGQWIPHRTSWELHRGPVRRAYGSGFSFKSPLGLLDIQ